MKIIAVQSCHVPLLSELARETFSESFGHLYPPADLLDFVTKSYATEVLMTQVKDPAQFWRLALDKDGAAAGYVQCGPVTLPHPEARAQSHGELRRIYVRATSQGLGIGGQLLTAALDHLSLRYGNAPQWLGVYSGNRRAQDIYAAAGFERVGEYRFAVGSCLDEEYIMRRLPGADGATKE